MFCTYCIRYQEQSLDVFNYKMKDVMQELNEAHRTVDMPVGLEIVKRIK